MNCRKIAAAVAAAALSLPPAVAGPSREEKEARVFEMVEDATEVVSAETISMELFRNTNLSRAVRGKDEENLLLVALRTDREMDVVSVLLDAEIDVDYRTKSGRTALMYAARHSSRIEVVEEILTTSAFFSSTRRKRILAEDADGRNAYDWAAQNQMPGMREAVFALFSKYEPVPEKYRNLPPSNPSEEKAAKPRKAKKKKKPAKTEEKAAEPTKVGPAAKTEEKPSGPTEKAEAEIAEKPDSDSSEAFGGMEAAEEPPAEPQKAGPSLVRAIATISAAVAEPPSAYLYDYAEEDDSIPSSPSDAPAEAASDGGTDIGGRTALMLAARNGDVPRIRELLSGGAAVDEADGDGWTALMYAARHQKSPEPVRVLVDGGADIRRRNSFGVSALMLASAFNPEPGVTAALLANRSASESDVRSSFMHAIQSGAPIPVLEEFRKRGISLNTPLSGRTALMYAAESGTDTRTLAWLLQNGAARGATTADGMTAFDFASANSKLPRDDVFWSLAVRRK